MCERLCKRACIVWSGARSSSYIYRYFHFLKRSNHLTRHEHLVHDVDCGCLHTCVYGCNCVFYTLYPESIAYTDAVFSIIVLSPLRFPLHSAPCTLRIVGRATRIQFRFATVNLIFPTWKFNLNELSAFSRVVGGDVLVRRCTIRHCAEHQRISNQYTWLYSYTCIWEMAKNIFEAMAQWAFHSFLVWFPNSILIKLQNTIFE